MRLFWYLAVTGAVISWMDNALAQRRPIADDTLGEERSIVTPLDPDAPVDVIEGGAERGDNLFHSFQEFHVDEGRGVYFDDRGFANIISRVTGGVASEILGVLGVIGDANLFLINPSGIIFGPGASLDVSGSFVATTADSFVFENGFAFSATNPQAPPLLTVSVPIGLQYGAQTPGAISVNQAGLSVDSGQSLVLAGGPITLNNSGLVVRSPQGGRIELGSVSGTGAVGLEQNGNILSLNFPESVARADVQIINGSGIGAVAEDGGSVAINARNIDILSRSFIRAGIGRGQGTTNGQAGDITLNATGLTRIAGSAIVNLVFPNAIGNSGDIRITTDSLSLIDGGALSASTLGQGNAGDMIIEARDRIVFDDSNAISAVEGGVGNAGNIEIDTNSLEVRNRAQLFAGTSGRGNAGSVIIDADARAVFDRSGAALSSVEEGGVGNAGNIEIDTNSLEVRNGAQLIAGTNGRGNAGSVIIDADARAVFGGISADGQFGSAAISGVNESGVGNAGNIEIDTNSLEVRNGAQLIAGTNGRGNAGSVIIDADARAVFDNSTVFSTVEDNSRGRGGNINIVTGSLVVRNGAGLTAGTIGQGRAGNIRITADTVSLDGMNSAGRSSGLFTSTITGAAGRGGDIVVRANSVRLTDGAVVNAQTVRAFRGGDVTINADMFEATGGGQVITTTDGSGRAGNITLNVTDRITLSGFDPNYDDRLSEFGEAVISNQGETSGLFANTAEGSSGRGGTIRIRTGELNISDRARVSVNNQGSGVAGDIDITAQSVELDRGRLTAETNTVEGGNIAIATDSLSLTNGAQISVNSVAEDEGGAGNVEVQARNVELDEASEITAETASGQGGNITLSDVELLLLRNGSLISTTAGTEQAGGDGGNIAIDADFIVAFPNENSDIQADAFTGSGGNIDITSEGLFGIEAREAETEFSDITASSELGVQGTININTPDVDPSRGLTELPEDVVDASDQIAQTCPTDGDIAGEVGEFVVTGRGGLPADPAEILGGETVLSELAEVEGEAAGGDETGEHDENDGEMRGEIDRPSEIANNEQAEIVEAQGWVVGADGKVMLTAEHSTVEPHRSPIAPVSCPSS